MAEWIAGSSQAMTGGECVRYPWVLVSSTRTLVGVDAYEVAGRLYCPAGLSPVPVVDFRFPGLNTLPKALWPGCWMALPLS